MTVTAHQNGAHRSSVPGRAGVTGLLRAEWTKLFSVPRWTAALAAAVLVTGLVSLLAALGANDGDAQTPTLNPFQDGGHFAYTSLTGDAELVTELASRTGEGAKAGLMIRSADQPGATFAAVVTNGASVHFMSGPDVDIEEPVTSPMWLRLTLSGGTITAYKSADGTTWHSIGSAKTGLTTAVGGPFLAVPDKIVVTRQFGSESITGEAGHGTAVFDHLTVNGADPGAWTPRQGPTGPAADPKATSFEPTGTGAYRMTGVGDFGPDPFASDPVKDALGAMLIAAVTIAAVAVVAVTAEYRRGMIRTSFIVTPRRGRTLLAKAAVLGVVAFIVGVLAAITVYAGAGMRPRGIPSMLEWPVPRALLGCGLLTALIAVYALGLGALLKRGAAAIAVALVTLTVPLIVSSGVPLSVAVWLERLTPAAGFAVEQAVPRYDTAIGPWGGLAVLAGYAALALGLALWRQSRRNA